MRLFIALIYCEVQLSVIYISNFVLFLLEIRID